MAPVRHRSDTKTGYLEALMRVLAGLTLGVLAWLMPQGVRADAPLFVYADAQAQVHVTDRLADVPEPYYSIYAARLAAKRPGDRDASYASGVDALGPGQARRVDLTGDSRDRVAALSPGATQQAARRTAWRQQMATARTELTAATEALAQLEKTLAETGMNPILRLTPDVQARMATLEQQRVAARARVLDSRRRLLETLPQQAQREHIPPQWLQ